MYRCIAALDWSWFQNPQYIQSMQCPYSVEIVGIFEIWWNLSSQKISKSFLLKYDGYIVHRNCNTASLRAAVDSFLLKRKTENIIDFNCQRAGARLTIKHRLKFQIRFVGKFFWNRRAHDETQLGPSSSFTDEVFMSLSIMKTDQCINYLRLEAF